MRHDRRTVGARHENHVDRRVDHRAFGQVNERAVLHERGVQRGKAAAGEVRELAEVALYDVRVIPERDRERTGVHAGRQPLHPRQSRVEPPVDDHEPNGRVGVWKTVQSLGRSRDGPGGHEIDRAQSARIGEAPLLVTDRRDAERRELRRAARSKIVEPPRAPLWPAIERAGERCGLFCYVTHAASIQP